MRTVLMKSDVDPRGLVIRRGTVSVTTDYSSQFGGVNMYYGTGSISYSGFSSVPTVVVSVHDLAWGLFTVELEGSPRVDGAVVTVFGGSAIGSSLKVDWIAIGV